ncbi:Hypothetical predicted protein [Pelobates cultripes]|uniref:Uncharacterized protein n=1 Tax=Pelobates cultripes TaxID=61616 RepID=A0AAD1WQF0_PELCU|nr:Hypothetical predicted protein [Pelobates cultripes]
MLRKPMRLSYIINYREPPKVSAKLHLLTTCSSFNTAPTALLPPDIRGLSTPGNNLLVIAATGLRVKPGTVSC